MSQKLNISLNNTTRHHRRVVEISLIIFSTILISISILAFINPLSGKISTPEETDTHLILRVTDNNQEILNKIFNQIAPFENGKSIASITNNSRFIGFHFKKNQLKHISYKTNNQLNFYPKVKAISNINIKPNINSGLIYTDEQVSFININRNTINIKHSIPFEINTLLANSNSEILSIFHTILPLNQYSIPWNSINSGIITKNINQNYTQIIFEPTDDQSELNTLRLKTHNLSTLALTNNISKIREIIRNTDLRIQETITNENSILNSENTQIIKDNEKNLSTLTSNTNITPNQPQLSPICNQNAHSFISHELLVSSLNKGGYLNPNLLQIIQYIDRIEISKNRISLCLAVDKLWK